jgi:hypothetical protein
MQQGEFTEVVVRVADQLGSEAVREGLSPTDIVVEPALVGSDLVADLHGSDFTVERVGNDDGRRVLGSRNYAEWRWNVRPMKSGMLKLQIVLYVRVQDGGSPIDV